MKRIVIIGAGLAGLGAAYGLQRHQKKYSVTLLEKEDRPGGLCRTVQKDGFFFDQTGHLLHFQTRQFKQFVMRILPNRLVERQRNSWVYSHDVYTHYPFQANLYGLPPDVVTECLYRYCEAFFGSHPRKIKTFEDWIIASFGSGIAESFMIPYNTKLYKRHPSKLTPDCAGRFIPRPDLRQVIRGAVAGDASNLGYNATFFYPKRGGIESLVKAIAHKLGGLRAEQEVQTIDLKRKKVATNKGEGYDFDFLVSTIPLPELVRMLDEAPQRICEAARSLKYVSVLNINLGIKGLIKGKHWIYIPEDRYVFYRIGFAQNFAESMAPPGCSSIYTEISYKPSERPNVEGAVRRVISDLIAMKIIRSQKDVLSRMVIDIPYAYVIFDHSRNAALRTIQNFLIESGIFSIGRYGRWEYKSMEDSFMDGLSTAQVLCQRGGDE